jgi:hypothetical protein
VIGKEVGGVCCRRIREWKGSLIRLGRKLVRG